MPFCLNRLSAAPTGVLFRAARLTASGTPDLLSTSAAFPPTLVPVTLLPTFVAVVFAAVFARSAAFTAFFPVFVLAAFSLAVSPIFLRSVAAACPKAAAIPGLVISSIACNILGSLCIRALPFDINPGSLVTIPALCAFLPSVSPANLPAN